MDTLLNEAEKMDFDDISCVHETILEYSMGHVAFTPPDFLKGLYFTVKYRLGFIRHKNY